MPPQKKKKKKITTHPLIHSPQPTLSSFIPHLGQRQQIGRPHKKVAVKRGDAQPLGAANAHDRFPPRRPCDVVLNLGRQPRPVPGGGEAGVVVQLAARVLGQGAQGREVDGAGRAGKDVDRHLRARRFGRVLFPKRVVRRARFRLSIRAPPGRRVARGATFQLARAARRRRRSEKEKLAARRGQHHVGRLQRGPRGRVGGAAPRRGDGGGRGGGQGVQGGVEQVARVGRGGE